MAPKLPLELKPPSSSEEEGSDSELGSDSESEPENPSANTTAQPQPPVSDEDESGSDTDSDSDSARKTDLTTKTVAAGTVKSLTTKPRSKLVLLTSPSTAKSGVGAKRPEDSGSKRVRKKLPVTEDEEVGGGKKVADDQKKQLFQRLWSEEDEIVILKGIQDYVEKKGADPVNDMNSFHDFIKKSLHIDVTRTQLQDKVRRLKKKFVNNASKEKPGKDRTFSKVHEQKTFDLSKKIWASDGKLLGIDHLKANGALTKKPNQKAGRSGDSPLVDSISSPEVTMVEVKQNAKPEQRSVSKRKFNYGRTVADPALEEEILVDGLELIKRPKRLELEGKWKKLREEEVELYLKRVELIQEQTALVLAAMKSKES